ncbi:hypothetical protein LSH36_761g00005 [Paralvinella palmiformis]|uniref:Uncharacterized protein n=1 Tax=Paralvinella palmiformis TaxID=53620 RepID=A0AAD9J2D8_9ANNE|nr:hypothetical protein LSH36_761g00005 [Paralvinella palmiformis]
MHFYISRRHDQTLQCIYTAFTRCQPTKADLQLMAYRIGHLRDFMLRECRIARARTTATITTTTTTSTTVTTTRTRARTATGTHRPPSHVLKDAADSNRDRNNVWRANGPVYVIDGASPSSPDADERFRVIDAVGVNELGNDTHSKLRESSSRKDHGFVLLCQMENDKSRTECLLEAYGGASSTGRQSSVTWRVLLSLVTICVIRF